MGLEKIIIGLSLVLYGCAPAIAPVIEVPMPDKTKNTLHINPPVPTPEIGPAPVPNPSIEFMYADFIESVKDPNYPNDIKGVIAISENGNFIFKHGVLRQVTVDQVYPDNVTEFRLFKDYHNLPWNYGLLFEKEGVLGSEPNKLNFGDFVIIVFGDGTLNYFRIEDTITGKVSILNNPWSPIELSDIGLVSADVAARHIYLGDEQGEKLVIQVCGENPYYRYFTIATKIPEESIKQQN